MSDQLPYPGTDDTDVRPEPRRPGMPLWVKVFLLIAVLLILAFVISSLVGVEHGPRMHGPGGSDGGSSSIGVMQP